MSHTSLLLYMPHTVSCIIVLPLSVSDTHSGAHALWQLPGAGGYWGQCLYEQVQWRLTAGVDLEQALHAKEKGEGLV